MGICFLGAKGLLVATLGLLSVVVLTVACTLSVTRKADVTTAVTYALVVAVVTNVANLMVLLVNTYL